MWNPKSELDPYVLKARVLPIVCGVAPPLGLGLVLFPRLSTALEIKTLIGGLVIFAAIYFLSQLGRDRGKVIEHGLFRKWGGKPSVAMLRHRDSRLDIHTKQRWRAFLEAKVPGLVLATKTEEARCPLWADEGYESATRWLLTQTRGVTRFRILHAENANYGFRRNLLGLKWHVLALNAASLMVFSGWCLLKYDSAPNIGMSIEVWVYPVITMVHSVIFLSVVRPAWVKVMADAYASQLLACCDDLASESDTS